MDMAHPLPEATRAARVRSLDALTARCAQAWLGAVRSHAARCRSIAARLTGRPLTPSMSRQVTVEAALSEAGRASGVAMSAGADRLRGPLLRVSGQEAIAEELLRDAVAAARRKAEHLAQAAGRSLGPVISVAEDDEEIGYPWRGWRSP